MSSSPPSDSSPSAPHSSPPSVSANVYVPPRKREIANGGNHDERDRDGDRERGREERGGLGYREGPPSRDFYRGNDREYREREHREYRDRDRDRDFRGGGSGGGGGGYGGGRGYGSGWGRGGGGGYREREFDRSERGGGGSRYPSGGFRRDARPDADRDREDVPVSDHGGQNGNSVPSNPSLSAVSATNSSSSFLVSNQTSPSSSSSAASLPPPSSAHTNSSSFSSNDFRGERSHFDRDHRRRNNVPMQRDPRIEAELFGDAKRGIEFKNYEDIPVETSGLNVPPPVDKFTDLQVHEVLGENINLCGYEHPTPIQKYGIPIALANRDLMAAAQTGSGKTFAFLLPMVASILKNELHLRPNPSAGRPYRSRCAYPSGLILSPTRELAIQIHRDARKVTYRTGLRVCVVYGGADTRSQLQEVERGCDIVVATPGRLLDFIERGRISLTMISFLVFDEADRMLDMGFEPDIRRIVEDSDMPAENRQTLMFSATFPKEIQRLAADFLKNYVFVAVGRVGSTTDFITQKVEYASNNDGEKNDKLMQILATCEGLTLIFVETRRGADALEYLLMREGIEATSIHGDRSQEERENALHMFRIGRCPVLVATDVASRGLDIPDVRCVINYDMPNNIDDYVHRIGRTGRAGNKGTAIAFVNEKDKAILRDLSDLMKENNQDIPAWFDDMVREATGFSGHHHSGGGYRRGGRGGYRGGGGGGGYHRDNGGGGGGGGSGRSHNRDVRSNMQGTVQKYNAGSSRTGGDSHSSHGSASAHTPSAPQQPPAQTQHSTSNSNSNHSNSSSHSQPRAAHPFKSSGRSNDAW